ncbi:shikimate dehydrogenase [Haloarcula hispanica]|uniref:Shikimate dehydrogenase n=1 Tax=Haloarcula hispanica TaxID=51589 RepID=A0A5J5LLF6_HALHI|nr:N-acetylneuraminate synthase family protein [Haloarcula hispanica]KAA9410366.1 shikimate dehydrogenase [Haloarcula hispanica]
MTIQYPGGEIGPDKPTFVIAEAGSNHNGDLDKAKQLVDAAVDAGADAVKFQTFRAEDHYVENSGGADYIQDDRSLYEILESLEMPYEWIPELHAYAEKRDILFLSTPSDIRSARELDPHVPFFKIESFNLSNHQFLDSLTELDKPLLLSTGAHDLDEIRESVAILNDLDLDFILLHCVSAYPTPLEKINVRSITTLKNEFDVPIGFSDHTLDPSVAPSAAVALGACVVEKHFTLDKSMDGPDHEFALEPDELTEMVDSIRKTETVLGDGTVRVVDEAEELKDLVRRFVQATDDVSEGEVITRDNTDLLSPGKRRNGVKPKHYETLLGRTATRDIPSGAGVRWQDVEGGKPDESEK